MDINYRNPQEIEDVDEVKAYAALETDQPANIILAEDLEVGLPKGKEGEIRSGFAFYELVEKKNGKIEEHYITSQIGDRPVLKSRFPKQYERWCKQKIVAKPIPFVWDNERGFWTDKLPENR